MSRKATPRAGGQVTAQPRLLIDAAIAAFILLFIAYYARTTLTPDGVAYFENAELFARGQWSEAIQGYWSPGYSLLLVPVVWLAGEDRALFLSVAHLLQALLAIAALWLSVLSVRARVPALAQRAVFWGCAWIELRWLTQEVLTPDLLLCVLLLLFIVRLPAHNKREQLILGAIAGAGFLVKTSIWPWLVVALAIASFRCVRAGNWRLLPLPLIGAAAAIAGAFVVTLSIRAGHPTLGSVGPLNARWYLGDLERRTPDGDLGPHATKKRLVFPTGVAVPFHDLRAGTRTYLPWSDPERWANGIPANAVPSLSVAQAVRSWTGSFLLLFKWLVPLAIALAVIVAMSGRHSTDSTLVLTILDQPLLLVGVLNILIFLTVHAEARLLAPAMLQCLLGVWSTAPLGRAHKYFPWASRAMVAGVLVQLAMYTQPIPRNLSANAAREGERHRYLDEQLVRRPTYSAIIVGPAVSWMGALWRHHMHVALQIGGEGAATVKAMPEGQRLQW
ncbi:MAG: hypothetical protein NTU67_09355, partial [Gemmatimonadetes bacterium]|nr:hypothetical protein [Gemmatimonadota bacterium]